MKINGKSDREKDEEKEKKVKQILDCMEVYMPLCIHYKYSKTPTCTCIFVVLSELKK